MAGIALCNLLLYYVYIYFYLQFPNFTVKMKEVTLNIEEIIVFLINIYIKISTQYLNKCILKHYNIL